MKQIIITETETGKITLSADAGIKWSTFITGIEMLIEVIKDNALPETKIDDILDDIRRIYMRDKRINEDK